MASPVDAARVSTNITTGATSHNINVGSPVAGTLLIVAVTFSIPSTKSFSGYTQIFSNVIGGASGDDSLTIFYRWADGSEGADDVLSTSPQLPKLGAICWEITGAEDPATQAPEVSTAATGLTTLNTANPGSRAVTGGPKDVLYLAIAGGDGEVGAYTAAPTNYVNLATANSGTGGAAATNNFMGGASRQISASSSDDPGAFTHAAHTNGWCAVTVVIHPASSVAAPGPAIRRQRRASRYLTFR